jgi:hypothetical protein
MKARNVFGIIVRVLALCLLLVSLWHVTIGLSVAYGSSLLERGWTYPYNCYLSLVIGISSFVVAVLLLRFARQIVRFSYPGDKEDTDA